MGWKLPSPLPSAFVHINWDVAPNAADTIRRADVPLGPWRRPCIDGTEMMAMTTIRAMMLRTVLRMQWRVLSVADSLLFPDRVL